MSSGPRMLQLFLVVALFLSSGCQAQAGYYRGALADKGTVVPFVADQPAKWADQQVNLNYVFKPDGNKMSIVGNWTFANYPQIMMAHAKNFRLKLFLLDQNKRVLEGMDLSTVAWGGLEEKRSFQKAFVVPAGTAYASFGYDGNYQGEYQDPGESVWKLPKKDL